ncbi:MAG: hypothetical protein FWD59_10055, partial [Micrococcales bacterium]|nr:hypothetical protein [Micrococcales bacterium]
MARQPRARDLAIVRITRVHHPMSATPTTPKRPITPATRGAALLGAAVEAVDVEEVDSAQGDFDPAARRKVR